jgi:hypothetical protein
MAYIKCNCNHTKMYPHCSISTTSKTKTLQLHGLHTTNSALHIVWESMHSCTQHFQVTSIKTQNEKLLGFVRLLVQYSAHATVRLSNANASEFMKKIYFATISIRIPCVCQFAGGAVSHVTDLACHAAPLSACRLQARVASSLSIAISNSATLRETHRLGFEIFQRRHRLLIIEERRR